MMTGDTVAILADKPFDWPLVRLFGFALNSLLICSAMAVMMDGFVGVEASLDESVLDDLSASVLSFVFFLLLVEEKYRLWQ